MAVVAMSAADVTTIYKTTITKTTITETTTAITSIMLTVTGMALLHATLFINN
jgi:hypothetical protein